MFINAGDYDDSWGIDEFVIDYIKESLVIGSRVSPVKCYLFFRRESRPQKTITVPSLTNPFVLWQKQLNSTVMPDIRFYKDAIRAQINGVSLTRVVNEQDIEQPTEFAVLYNAVSKQVLLVFHPLITSGELIVQYREVSIGIVEGSQYGNSPDMSEYGWEQYKCPQTPFNGKNQILVRFPLSTENLTLDEQGKIIVEQNTCWMIWEPYVRDFDLLVWDDPAFGKPVIFEIQDKQDSYIQGHLISQRFSIFQLDFSDPRYKLLEIMER